jgi:two-component system, NtrC family, response regulator PilR
MPATVDHRDASTENLRARLKWFLFCRVVIVSCFLGALSLAYLGSGEDGYTVSVSFIWSTIAATYALTIASAVFLLRLERLEVFSHLQVGFDVLLTTGVIFITGGADSPFGFLYSLEVINAAILLSTAAAMRTATCAAVAYGALVVGLVTHVFPRPYYPFPPAPLGWPFAIRFATTNATFFLIAVLAGSLVRRLHQAESLLEEREAERDRLASLQDALARNIGSALITTDGDGRVTSLNQTAEELLGAKNIAVVGKDVGALFPPLRHTMAGRLQFLQSAGAVCPTEFQQRTADDQELTLRCSAVPLQDTYHHPIGALYIVQDITALRRLEERLQAGSEDAPLPDEPPSEEVQSRDGLIGSSPAICRVRSFTDKVARADATVLIMGESGTGKELVARAIHARSPRRDRPFVAVNCGAIPATLIESELFGHVRGAYTGATTSRAGLFRTADSGTIFLDEIGDLPQALQVKLLRVLQERSFTPIGADTHVSVDVRVIAATNHDLAEEVRSERFRDDLYYRLNVLTVELPPLRERRQDIPHLIRRFLRQFAELHGKSVQRLSVSAARRLQEYPYPGNVRELENIIEHAVALCDGETVHEQHLPDYVRTKLGAPELAPEPVRVIPVPTPAIPVSPSAPLQPGADNLDDNLAAYEKTILLRALSEAGGVKKRAAELLGINYRSFRHRLQKYGLSEPTASYDA